MQTHHGYGNTPLREICFDFAAGMFDRSKFHALVRSSLSVRMACDDVQLRCRCAEVTGLLDRLKGVGWISEVVEGRQLLHAAMAHNGRLIGLLSCAREAGAPAWTKAEGIALLRHAMTLSHPAVCPSSDAEPVKEEGVQA